MNLIRRLRKAKEEAVPIEKPDVVKTHLRNMIILPEVIRSMVGVYNGKTSNQVEINQVSIYLTISLWSWFTAVPGEDFLGDLKGNR